MIRSRTRFVLCFLLAAFVFVGSTNALLGPVNGDWFPGMDSPLAWKRTLASLIYPIKLVLVGPLAPVFNDPDPAPPVRALACAVYWTVLASILYALLSKRGPRAKA